MYKSAFIIVLMLVSISLHAQDVMKCDTRLVRMDKAGTLTATEISLFLMTLGEECRDNVEFSEMSNELLFVLLDKQTALTLQTFQKIESGTEKPYILDMLTSPVNDAIDVKSIITKVEKTNAGGQLKPEILRSLNEALAK